MKTPRRGPIVPNRLQQKGCRIAGLPIRQPIELLSDSRFGEAVEKPVDLFRIQSDRLQFTDESGIRWHTGPDIIAATYPRSGKVRREGGQDRRSDEDASVVGLERDERFAVPLHFLQVVESFGDLIGWAVEDVGEVRESAAAIPLLGEEGEQDAEELPRLR
jgi:hypothetical protein